MHACAGGDASARLSVDIAHAMMARVPLLLVHEMLDPRDPEKKLSLNAASRYPCEFGTFFQPDQTPEPLLRAGIYDTVAVGFKGGAWRKASRAMLVQKILQPARAVQLRSEIVRLLESFVDMTLSSLETSGFATAATSANLDDAAIVASLPAVERRSHLGLDADAWVEDDERTLRAREAQPEKGHNAPMFASPSSRDVAKAEAGEEDHQGGDTWIGDITARLSRSMSLTPWSATASLPPPQEDEVEEAEHSQGELQTSAAVSSQLMPAGRAAGPTLAAADKAHTEATIQPSSWSPPQQPPLAAAPELSA